VRGTTLDIPSARRAAASPSKLGNARVMTFHDDLEFENADPPLLTGRVVLDNNLSKVGKVTDVISEDERNQRRWAVVQTGLFGSEHFVPLDDSYVDETGTLVVPLLKSTIKHAPKANREHVMTTETRREVRDYYSVAA
jgi:hypothetical protein